MRFGNLLSEILLDQQTDRYCDSLRADCRAWRRRRKKDEGLLESALAKPKNLAAYGKPILPELAASYAYGIVRNHPFADGNKRVGLIVAGTFLCLNGWELNASEVDAANIFFQLADGKVSEKELADWFENNCS